MSLVQETARRSTCLRRQVGCVLLNERGHVLATGYNGVAAGLPHCNEVTYASGIPHEPLEYGNSCLGAKAPSGQQLDGCQAIHAEQNALLQCKDVYEIHTAYVSASPCMTCVKLLLNTSCQCVVFKEEYPHAEAHKLWTSAGREWLKFDQL
jgi:dCMP deaminase